MKSSLLHSIASSHLALTSEMEDTHENSLRQIFQDAQKQSAKLDSFVSTSDPIYQENLRSAIKAFGKCREIAGRISLFSPNETLEDIASADLP